MNHENIVRQIHDAEPASTWQSADAMLGFVLRVIAALPPGEHAGLVKAPQSGENVAHYAPADQWVRVNRVGYPDGTLAKILLDSGVGGANTPAWNESADDPGLYVPIVGAPVPVPIPEPEPVPPVDLAPLEKMMKDVADNQIALGRQVDSLGKAIEELTGKPDPQSPPVIFPKYTGSIFGYRVTLTPETK